MSSLVSPPDFSPLYGDKNRCPHCEGLTTLERHDAYRWVCAVCGGPRVPLKNLEKLPDDAVTQLRAAGSADRSSVGWRAATWLLGFPSAISLAAAIAFGAMSLVVGGALVGIGIILAILAARASSKSNTAKKRARLEVDAAWESVVAEIVRKDPGAARASTIAKALEISETEVERMLVSLSAHDKVRIDVADDAHMVARTTDIPEEREEEEEEEEEPAKAKK